MTLEPLATSQAWLRYARIQQFKQRPEAEIDGVNYARVVATYLYNGSKLGLLKKVALALWFSPRLTLSGSKRPLLLFYSHRYKKRPDYDYVITQLQALAGDHGQLVESNEEFSLFQFWHTLSRLSTATRAAQAYEGGILERFGVALLIAKFHSIAERSSTTIIEGRGRVFTFSDALPHDNLMAQLAARQGIETITAQHGQYRVLDSTNISSDAEAYANFVSDRMLAWGEATITEFERFGVSPERMLVSGWIRARPESVLEREPRGVFGVILNGANGAASNPALMNAANHLSQALDLKYVVRAHPSYGAAGCEKMANERCISIGPMAPSHYLDSVDFSISHSSSATIEMLLADSPVYVLDDGNIAQIFRTDGLSYGNNEMLLEAMRADLIAEDRGRTRVERLKMWFNEDANQAERLREALFTDGTLDA
ncbi:hypothetical protein [Cryobacterium sp. AP23]